MSSFQNCLNFVLTTSTSKVIIKWCWVVLYTVLYTSFLTISSHFLKCHQRWIQVFSIEGGTQGWCHRGQGGKSPPKDFKKGENKKNIGYFHASKLLKLAFLSSLMRKYMLWKGFYHNFSTKKASASGGLNPTKGLCPLVPRWGHCPLDPQGPSPPNDLPWCRPWGRQHFLRKAAAPGCPHRVRHPVSIKLTGCTPILQK